MLKNRGAENFLGGALILSFAALISRLLGALYKPVIARIFAPFDGHHGAVGIGLTQIPLTVYMIILSFTSVGFNTGISKLVSERTALGDVYGAKQVFRLSLLLMALLGMGASLALWIGSPWIARLISKDTLDTIPGFKATAPALFFVSIMAAYRGMFQGLQYMTPNAYSQIIEQSVRVISGIFLTYTLVRVSVPMGAAGFNFGDVLGAVAGLGYLLILAHRAGSDLWVRPQENLVTDNASHIVTQNNPWVLMRRILGVAGPITLVGAVVPIMMMADTVFVFRALRAVGMQTDEIQAQYGLLTNVFMIINLPAVFTTAIYTSVLPSMTHATALGRIEEARSRTKQAYRMTVLLAIPAQAGLYLLATGLYALIYGDQMGGSVMASISWATAAIMLQQTTSGVLQGIGKIGLPVRNFILGALVKMALTALWTRSWGITGAAYATVVGFWVAAVLNLIAVERLLGRILHMNDMILRPLLSTLAMVASLALLQEPLHHWVPSPNLVTGLLILVGSLVYGLVALLIGAVTEQEMKYIPLIGKPLIRLFARRRL